MSSIPPRKRASTAPCNVAPKKFRLEETICDEKGPSPTPPPPARVKTRGVERISRDRIPPECIGAGEIARRHRRNFFLEHKTRLLAEGKLVMPGKEKCKLLADGATLEWESVGISRLPVVDASGALAAGHEDSKLGTTAQVGNHTGASTSSVRGPQFQAADNDVPQIVSMELSSDPSSDAEMDELDSSDESEVWEPPAEQEHKKHVATANTGISGSSSAVPIVISDDDDEEDADQAVATGGGSPPFSTLSPLCSKRIRRVSSSSSSSDVSITSSRKVKQAIRKRSSSIISVKFGSEPDSRRKLTLRETKHVPVPKATYSRGRRVLVQGKYLVTISMRGDVQYFDSRKRERVKALSMPWDPERGHQHVEDACSVHGYGIIAFNNGPSQAVVVDGKTQVRLDAKPHKEGPSCVCPMDNSSSDSKIKFLSGGHDHTVRQWTVNASGKFSSKVATLAIVHSSVVHALAYISTHSRVVSASNRKVSLYDIDTEKQVERGPSSNPIYQIHVQSNQPNIMATEVNHLDRQINIYDLRRGFTDKPPCIDMGYRSETSHSPCRYDRGAFEGCLFARGYRDGTIKVFDIRNAKNVVCTTLTQRETPAEHTFFWKDNTIVAFGGSMLSFLDFSYS